jgi:NAD(P)-dependent dehydrogenase (short-subunit alcohol dehydrogenase family)
MSAAGPLAGQRALVVGGSAGIGMASTAALLADGAHVVIAGRGRPALEAAAAKLEPIAKQGGASLEWTVCDATRPDDVRAAVRVAEGDSGLDIALAIPGGGNYSPVLGYDEDDFMAQIDQNLRPAYTILKHAGLAMVRSGGGSIVLMSSTAAIMVSPYLAAYCAAKAALDQLVRVAAEELGKHRVRVNAVRPGLTETEGTGGLFTNEALLGRFLAEQPIPTPGQTTNIAGAVRFLAGPESQWVTGQSLTVDGGHTLRKFPDLEGLARQVAGDDLFNKVNRGEEP